MFTGLVAGLGEVLACERTDEGLRLQIASSLIEDVREGDSIAVNGVCLTASAVTSTGFAAEVMNETLNRSSLQNIDAGAEVNLELPLRPADRLGGSQRPAAGKHREPPEEPLLIGV